MRPPRKLSVFAPTSADRGVAAWWVALFVTAFAAHGWLFLDDGLYLDDWWTVALGSRDWPGFWMLAAVQTGQPLGALAQRPFFWLPDPVWGLRTFTFVALIASALQVRLIAVRSGLLAPGVGWWVALLAVALPANRMTFAVGITYHYVFLLCYLQGVLLAVSRERSQRSRYGWQRLLALGFMFVGFAYNALLPMHAATLGLLALQRWCGGGRGAWARWSAGRLDYVLLPFAYWAVKLLWMPSGDYNRLVLDPWGMVTAYTQAASTLWEGAQLAMAPGALVTLALAGVAVGLARGWPRPERVSHGERVGLLLAGLAILVLAVFPYAAVGKLMGPATTTYEAKNWTLMAFGMALLLVGGAVTVCRGLTRQAHVVLTAVLAVSCLGRAQVYVTWQAESIKWHAVCRQLLHSPLARDVGVFFVEDRFPIAPHNAVNGTGSGKLFAPSWTAYFSLCGLPGERLGIDRAIAWPFESVEDWRRRELAHWGSRYLFPGRLDPSAGRALLRVSEGPAFRGPWQLWQRYTRLRFLDRARLQAFLLDEVARVELRPVPAR